MGNNENPTNNRNHSPGKPQKELFNNYNQLQYGSLFEKNSFLLCEAVSASCDAVSSRNRQDLIQSLIPTH